MKFECRQQLKQMVNVITMNNNYDPRNDNEIRKISHDDQSETAPQFAIRRLVKMTINKPSCNIDSDPIHDISQEQNEQKPLNIHHRPTRQCAVHMEDQPFDQFEKRYSEQCQHKERTICDLCVYNNVEAALKDMQITSLTCPELGCQAVFGYNEVCEILLKNNNQALFELYDRQLTHQHLEQMSEFIWCPHPGCGSGQLIERDTSDRNRINCIKCNRMICSHHRIKWHIDMTCEEYDQLEVKPDKKTKHWLNKYSKQCPQCKSPIQKAEGCDHMTCTKCNHQFCWECLVNYNLIRGVGLDRHKRTCSHYRNSRQMRRMNRFRTNRCTIS
ncbi:unnamed protein product [Adineta steineri]|nr:unnamed protein product [Adineta steineri]